MTHMMFTVWELWMRILPSVSLATLPSHSFIFNPPVLSLLYYYHYVPVWRTVGSLQWAITSLFLLETQSTHWLSAFPDIYLVDRRDGRILSLWLELEEQLMLSENEWAALLRPMLTGCSSRFLIYASFFGPLESSTTRPLLSLWEMPLWKTLELARSSMSHVSCDMLRLPYCTHRKCVVWIRVRRQVEGWQGMFTCAWTCSHFPKDTSSLK